MDKSEKKESFGKKYGLILALIAMAIVYLFPTPVDLPTQGHSGMIQQERQNNIINILGGHSYAM